MPSLFEKLPFQQAIEALRNRLALPKTPKLAKDFGKRGGRTTDFLSLDAANRSRAFTMARISDQGLLENIHDELSIAINDGDTFNDFLGRLDLLKERSGWTGTSSWHYRLVYDTNMGMAYAAGRVQQGQALGFKVWRYLPSISVEPRELHEQFYNNLYRMAPGTPVPPIDFNCNCGWEWLDDIEIESLGIDPATLPVFDPPVPASGFVWSATNYFDVQKTVEFNSAQWPGNVEGTGLVRVINRATEATPSEVRTWFELAVETASKIGAEKFDRVVEWAESLRTQDDESTLRGMLERIDDLLTVLKDDDEWELNHQVTLATLLKGCVDVAETTGART